MKSDKIQELLPQVFQRTARPDSPLQALLEAMEELTEPAEKTLAELDKYIDPYRAPEDFVVYLARWLDLQRFFSSSVKRRLETGEQVDPIPPGSGRLRELLITAARMLALRGTHRGLIAMLEIATGVEGFSVEESPTDESGQPIPFHIAVHLPPEAGQYRGFVRRIVEAEKPAYVTCELVQEEDQEEQTTEEKGTKGDEEGEDDEKPTEDASS
jgi:phage tail-like protein